MQTGTGRKADVMEILDLNREYLEAVKRSDVRWFNERLTDDFQCSLPDGSMIDRKRFLKRVLEPLDLTRLEVQDVHVRVRGDTAIVHARTTFTTADGQPGSGRYTDVWCREHGRWLAAAAHVTRVIE